MPFLTKKWHGPFLITDIDDKIVTVCDDDTGYRQRFNIQQVKPFFRDTPDANVDMDSAEILHSMLAPFRSCVAPQPPTYAVHLSETIEPHDPRAALFGDAKRKEIQGLIDRGTWKIVLKDEMPNNANVLGGRFVLVIKDGGTGNEIWKARYVVQGFRDRLKTSLVHDAATARQYSTKVLIGLAAVFGFRLFSTDVTQAFLQSADELMCDVYIQPSKEFELNENQVLKLLKPLYGLADAGDYWGKTMSSHLRNDLEMETTTSDAAFFFKRAGEKLQGMCATFVDDSLHAGDEDYVQLTDKTMQRFECREREWDDVTFAGMQIDTKVGEFHVHQKRYIDKLTPLSTGATTFAQYRSFRVKLAWITNTRPDITCAVAKAVQVTEKQFSAAPGACVKALNAIHKHLRTVPDLPLRFPKLDRKTLQLRVYSDASFASNTDGSSHLGYIIFLTDASGTCQPLYWSSHKSKRVTRSFLGSETMALADAFDMAYALKHDIQRMIKQNVPIRILTDNLSLFDVITKATTTAEKRLMIDLAALKQAYNVHDVEQLGFVRTAFNPADALTKVTRCPVLEEILSSARLNHPVDQ